MSDKHLTWSTNTSILARLDIEKVSVDYSNAQGYRISNERNALSGEDQTQFLSTAKARRRKGGNTGDIN